MASGRTDPFAVRRARSAASRSCLSMRSGKAPACVISPASATRFKTMDNKSTSSTNFVNATAMKKTDEKLQIQGDRIVFAIGGAEMILTDHGVVVKINAVDGGRP